MAGRKHISRMGRVWVVSACLDPAHRSTSSHVLLRTPSELSLLYNIPPWECPTVYLCFFCWWAFGTIPSIAILNIFMLIFFGEWMYAFIQGIFLELKSLNYKVGKYLGDMIKQLYLPFLDCFILSWFCFALFGLGKSFFRRTAPPSLLVVCGNRYFHWTKRPTAYFFNI